MSTDPNQERERQPTNPVGLIHNQDFTGVNRSKLKKPGDDFEQPTYLTDINEWIRKADDCN